MGGCDDGGVDVLMCAQGGSNICLQKKSLLLPFVYELFQTSLKIYTYINPWQTQT